MSILSKIGGALGGGLVKQIAEVWDDATLSKEEKMNVTAALMSKEMEAKERVLVAELNQDDAYTKRARPTVVYFGLLAIFLNHLALPWVTFASGAELPGIDLPTEFWWAWGGICSAWVIGRSAEKRGANDKLTKLITGG